ncbi:hypothetical protein WJX81_003839 [Elliptochloris bilobata]|uniref:Heat shock protein 70 n=1 Tax=Elliptochloris bilobata TaxID=381761 RepID=A0AAW1SL29_9CHLO
MDAGLRRASLHTVAGAYIGIDLGTSNSVVAVVEDGLPRVLPDKAGCVTTPSWVTFTEDAEVVVGAPARRQAAANPHNTFSSVKRIIGRPFSAVQAELRALPYAVVRSFDGSAELWCPALRRALAPAEVSAQILRHLVRRAEGYLGGGVEGAVIAVPAHFDAAQRAATAEAGRLAGLGSVQLLQEPVAAALAYGLGRAADEALILVFDLGGGTFDCSLVEAFEGCLEVIAAGGDARLGGDDWDRALLTWLAGGRRGGAQVGSGPGAALAAAAAAAAADARGDPAAMARLTEAAETAKRALSGAEAAAVDLVVVEGGPGFRAEVTRAEFEALTAPLRARLWPPLEAIGRQAFVEWAGRPIEVALAESLDLVPARAPTHGAPDSADAGGARGAAESGARAGAPAAERDAGGAAAQQRFRPAPMRITQVVMAGGASRMPAVRRLVAALAGVAPRETVNPEACVALGAAIQAGVLTGQISGVELADGAYSMDLHARASGFQGFPTQPR